MNSSQQSVNSTNSGACEPGNEAVKWPIDDESEIPLGCECANPALQIERWGLEAPLGSAEHR
jgi:hypothetical protein